MYYSLTYKNQDRNPALSVIIPAFMRIPQLILITSIK